MMRGGGQSGGGNSNMCYVEMDPSSRYGRLNEILGQGAMKTVYKAFDVVLGMEVAWSQVMLTDALCTSDELERLYVEVHLLKKLNHDSIIQFHKYWIDTDQRTFNFITEMLTSGTLREYRQKFAEVDIRAIKNWACQILRGLVHLHSLESPVVHRDLKCDNIFVNGHLGQVKIGDFGLATVLRGSEDANIIVGTPEFMAPEMYSEKYDERVDVYSFGMCVLEMLTSEYPYFECANRYQIYKKVTTGKKPEAFYRIQDPEAQQFVAKCLENASTRPSAYGLLFHPFLALEDDLMPVPGTPAPIYPPTGVIAEMPDLLGNHSKRTDMTITGAVNPDDNTLFLQVRLYDEDEHVRTNIRFPFDVVNDKAMDVAMEMVKELEITDWEPHEIADMIEEEISSLVLRQKALDSLKCFQLQHSFNFNDDDDENYPTILSSSSPSHDSLAGLPDSFEGPLSHDQDPVYNNLYDFHQGHLLHNEDAVSERSSSFDGYSDIEYVVQHNDTKREGCSTISSFPQENTTIKCSKKGSAFLDTAKGLGSTSHKKFNTIRSFMDIRSQLLHRVLMQAVSKQCGADTVGAVENIGFHYPV
ncbi:hypothetical protein vseg_003451 [Gypsophila vaccaria]